MFEFHEQFGYKYWMQVKFAVYTAVQKLGVGKTP